jgi:prepilin peptidase CpaA
LAAAVGFDVRLYKIPNLLIVIGLAIGVGYSYYERGWNGLLDSLTGIGIPVFILIVLHFLRILGAGDIKLFAVIGGMIGHSVWNVMLCSFVAGGLLAAIQMLYHHSLVSRIHFFWNYIHSCLQAGKLIPYESGFDEGNTSNTIHFSIAIFIGYIVWLIGRQVVE